MITIFRRFLENASFTFVDFVDLKIFKFKDVRGWQFLTMKAAETLCIVCLPPEEHIS